MYIRKLHQEPIFSDVASAAEQLISTIGLEEHNQISLKHRTGATELFLDGVGSLYDRTDKKFTGKESEFKNWSLPEDNPLVRSIRNLEQREGFTSGRVRIMRLMPRRGLSVHSDMEVRYHLALKTNHKSFFCWNSPSNGEEIPVRALCYHVPMDQHWYYADTRLIHWVYNGGDTDRIHIVVCADK